MTHITKIILLIMLIFSAVLTAQNSWIEKSYEDFADGTFSDAGANMYVSRNGRIQAVNRWDVNNDGAVDILCVNSHPLVEMLDMSIYWGNGKDFSIKNHSYIPANGPMWATADDLNNDGEMDLMVANYLVGDVQLTIAFRGPLCLFPGENVQQGDFRFLAGLGIVIHFDRHQVSQLLVEVKFIHQVSLPFVHINCLWMDKPVRAGRIHLPDRLPAFLGLGMQDDGVGRG